MFIRVFGIVVASVIMFGDVVASEEILQHLPMILCEKSPRPGQAIKFLYTPEIVFESKIDTIPDADYFITIRENFGNETFTGLARTYYELEEYVKYGHMAIEYSRIAPDDVRSRIRTVVTITGVLYDLLNR